MGVLDTGEFPFVGERSNEIKLSVCVGESSRSTSGLPPIPRLCGGEVNSLHMLAKQRQQQQLLDCLLACVG